MSISSYHHIICELLHPIINKGAGQIRTAWHFFRTAPCPAVNVWCARPVMTKIVAQPNWDYVIACRTRQRNLAPPMLSHSCGFGLVSGRLIVPGIVFLAPCPQPSQIPQQVCVGRVQYHGLFIVAPSFISRARHHPKSARMWPLSLAPPSRTCFELAELCQCCTPPHHGFQQPRRVSVGTRLWDWPRCDRLSSLYLAGGDTRGDC